MSDMAAHASGHRKTDHLKIMALCEVALEFACDVLRPRRGFPGKVAARRHRATSYWLKCAVPFRRLRMLNRMQAVLVLRSNMSWPSDFVAVRTTANRDDVLPLLPFCGPGGKDPRQPGTACGTESPLQGPVLAAHTSRSHRPPGG